MPERPADPLLEPARVRAASEHFAIVVALEDQRVAPGQRRFDVTRRGTDIGQHAEPPLAVGEHVLDRLARVVRAPETAGPRGPRPRTRHGSRTVMIRTPAPAPCSTARNVPCVIQTPQPVTACERKRAVEVIAVLVGDDDAGKVGRCEAEPREPPLGLLHREAAVEHQPRGARLDDEGVAGAAAAERREPHQSRSRITSVGHDARGHRPSRSPIPRNPPPAAPSFT